MGPSRTDKSVCMLLVLFAVIIFPLCATAGVVTEVTVNKSVLLNLQKPSERVSIATPAIAELVVISPTQLQINGTKIGNTSLIVWEKGGKTSFFDIRVTGDISQLEKQIKEIAPTDSITVDYANDTIVLSGKAANDQTIAKVFQIATAYAVKEKNSTGQSDRPLAAEAPGRKDGPDTEIKVLNHIMVDDPQQVLLEVKVAQVNKDALKSMGISLLIKGSSGEGFSNLAGAPNNLAGAPDNGIAGNIPWMGVISPLAPYQMGGSLYKAGIGGVLKALSTKELAKVLAEPNLLVKSGQEGNFFSGKKFYYPVVTSERTELKEITVGVKLKFRPEVLENGLIRLKIDPAEVSAITGNLVVNNATTPIIDSREIRTDVQLRDGESLVLGGLLQEETIKSMSKIPLLGDIPILGALFRSTQDDIKEKELLFFITPKIVKANAPGTVAELPTDKPLTPVQEKELQWMPLGK